MAWLAQELEIQWGMRNSLTYLLDIMSDPENRVLVILDSSGSIGDTPLEDALFDMALAHTKSDPLGARLTAITDNFANAVLSKPSAVAIPVGALTLRDIPGEFFGGGGEGVVENVVKQEIYQALKPTHVLFYTDLMMPSIELKDLDESIRGRVTFCVIDSTPSSLDNSKALFGNVGKVIPASTAEHRCAVLAQLDAEILEEQTPALPSAARRLRM
jgi:hypothetical protein